jgi:hypothetical protein
MNTIVTAFMTDINQIHFRSAEEYMELGNKLLALPIPKIFFVESHIYDIYYATTTFPLTTFIPFERKDNYLYPFLSGWKIPENLQTNNPRKDTPEYMIVQCHKTEWLKMAVKQNPYQTTDFTWIDFGIYHMIHNEEGFQKHIKQISNTTFPLVRIASCIDPNDSCHIDLFSRVVWFFCGSVIGGNSEKLLQLADLMKEKCLTLLLEKKHLTWEVNIWYMLFQEHKELFDSYKADHNISILSNYC